ncbi:hypothetical protein C6P40_005158, partial [Pichia californica]
MSSLNENISEKSVTELPKPSVLSPKSDISDVNNDSKGSNDEEEDEEEDDDVSPDSLEKFQGNNNDLERGSMESDDSKLMRIETHSNLSRELSRKLTNADAIKIDTSTPLPKMGKDRNYPPMLPDASDYCVAFD